MEIKKHKELYDAPSTRVFEVKTEGVICTSGLLDDPSDYLNGGDPFAAPAMDPMFNLF